MVVSQSAMAGRLVCWSVGRLYSWDRQAGMLVGR